MQPVSGAVKHDHLAQDFIAIMEKYHVDANDIVLEITESASITEKDTA